MQFITEWILHANIVYNASISIKCVRAQLVKLGWRQGAYGKGAYPLDWSIYQSKLYSAAEEKTFSFNQLCQKGHRIQYKRWCPIEDTEVPYQQIQKGYEIAKDNYVLLEKQELENIKLKTTRTIDIKEFVDAKELDPIFVQKSLLCCTRQQDARQSLLTAG